MPSSGVMFGNESQSDSINNAHPIYKFDLRRTALWSLSKSYSGRDFLVSHIQQGDCSGCNGQYSGKWTLSCFF